MKRLDYYWNSINLISLSLLPLSGVFCLLGLLRAKLYHAGLLKSYRAPVPVVIIGNITAGGTGKTPMIIKLVEQLQKQGKKPAVISRGYGGQSTSWPQRVTATSTAEQVGDEPVLIFQRTACPVVVGPNRRQDIERLLADEACDVVLSDDGLQHYALQRDIEIAVVDASRKFGNGFCIPSGPLRERVTRLQQVDMVLLNGGDETQDSFKLLATSCVPVSNKTDENLDLSSFAGKTVHAVAGIGHPERFFTMLKQQNINVLQHVFPDHYAYKESELKFSDDLAVLMTEKDAVKCRGFSLNNHWSVPVDIVFSNSAQNKLNQLLDLNTI